MRKSTCDNRGAFVGIDVVYGYVSEQNYRKYFPDIVEDIRAFLDGKPLRVIQPK